MSRHIPLCRPLCALTFLAIVIAVTGCSVSAPVTQIAITPVNSQLPANSAAQLHAVVTEPSGQTEDVTSTATWSSSDVSVATVSGQGLLAALSAGSATITASYTTGSASAVIHVAGPSMSSLSLTPAALSVPAGATQQYLATVTYSDNSSGPGTGVQWATSSASIATIASGGLLTAVSAGAYTVTATIGSLSARVSGSVIAPQATATPIPLYPGADLSRFSIFPVANYAASGSAATMNCAGRAGSKLLTCQGANDFVPGQGIRITGGGDAPVEKAVVTSPLVTQQGNGATGTHTYCYVVDTVDPLDGISAPSPQSCVSNEPALSLTTVHNSLTTTTSNVGPSPSFLWYVSEDSGPFFLLNVAKFTSDAQDLGQRIGSRGGWPDSLPASDASVAKQDDLFSTVATVADGVITLSDPLKSSVENAVVDHDDTQAVQSAILASVQAGGGTVTFGAGTFNLRRPAFAYVVDDSFAYPPYTTDIALDPWWAAYSRLYIPNGAAGNIDIEGAGRATTLVTPPDHGGTVSLLSVGNEQRMGAVGTPILAIEDVQKGAMQVTLASAASAAALSPGDDVFLYSGSFSQVPAVDTLSYPDMNHFSEINTVAAISGNAVTLVYPTTKRYFNDGSSSFGITKLPITPHNIELQHMNIATSEAITSSGDVIGMLVNDVQVQGTLSQGAFGGGYKRAVTIEHSQWSFGQGTSGWGQEDEYDQFTDLVFLDNMISGFAAASSESPSGMAKIYATEGTSQVLFMGNTFDHVSLYADQTTDFYVLNNTFVDGIIAAGAAYGAYTPGYDPEIPGDRSFLSFDSQEVFEVDHNTFSITAEFVPHWVIRGGDFTTSSISNNTIAYSGTRPPDFIIASFGGEVLNNTISVQSPQVGDIIALVPDESPITPVRTFVAEGNLTTASIIGADIRIPNPGFTDSAQVCVQNNSMKVSQGVAFDAAASIKNQQCP